MRKWMTALAAVGCAVLVGLAVRQVAEDLSDSDRLWRTVTDAPD